jgi:hypothetical protein
MKTLIALPMLLVITTAFSIELETESPILPWLNSQYEYEIVFISAQYDLEKMEMTPHKYTFYLNLTSKQIEDIKSLSYKEWIYLLEDNERGYITSVLLTFLYQVHLAFLTKEENELRFDKFKRDEIEYWSEMLENNFQVIQNFTI